MTAQRYDLAATFDCLHDMGDPLAAARHVRQALAPDGTPNAISQAGGYTLGAQAGEAAIRQLVTVAGFTRFGRAAETPFNLIYEARP